MAKKKTITPEKPKATTTSIGYEGTIKMTVKKGSKTVSTKTFKNHGCPKLFEFIAKAIAGDFTTKLMPTRIALFSRTTAETIDNPAFTNATRCSNFIYRNSSVAPTPKKEGEKVVGYDVTLSFNIPTAYITADEIAKLGLFTSDIDNDTPDLSEELCAYYLFLNEDKTNWKEEDITAYRGKNYSLYIDWTLTIQNNKESK